MTYNMQTQLALGKLGEKTLDEWFEKRGFKVDIVKLSVEKEQGIDRIVTLNARSFSVEYKTDYLAHRTKNIFLEMCFAKRAGWVLTSQAHTIVYYIPGLNVAYLFRPVTLRNRLDNYINKLKWREVHNEDYVAYGMLLPLNELEKIAYKKVII